MLAAFLAILFKAYKDPTETGIINCLESFAFSVKLLNVL